MVLLLVAPATKSVPALLSDTALGGAANMFVILFAADPGPLQVIFEANMKSLLRKEGCENDIILLMPAPVRSLMKPQRYSLRWKLSNFAALNKAGRTCFANALVSRIMNERPPSTTDQVMI